MRPGLTEILIVLCIILILFGAKRLPEIGGAIGKAIREFKKSTKDDETQKVEEKKNRHP